jgi:hypothetical protein
MSLGIATNFTIQESLTVFKNGGAPTLTNILLYKEYSSQGNLAGPPTLLHTSTLIKLWITVISYKKYYLLAGPKFILKNSSYTPWFIITRNTQT